MRLQSVRTSYWLQVRVPATPSTSTPLTETWPYPGTATKMRARVTAPSIVSFLRMSTAAFSEPPIQSAPPQSEGESRPVEKLEVAEAAPHVTVQLYSVSVLSVRPAGSGTNCVALLGAERTSSSSPPGAAGLTASVHAALAPRAPSASRRQLKVGAGSSMASGTCRGASSAGEPRRSQHTQGAHRCS